MPTTRGPAVHLSDLEGKRVVILGTGREGRAAADRLAPLVSSLAATSDTPVDGWEVPVLIAPDPGSVVAGFDIAVKSPGMSPRHPLVAALLEAGMPVTSGTDLWMNDHFATTTGVTGSKGKSTTASLISHLTPGSVLGGNIGVPLLSLDDAQRTVVELSSYQCQSLTQSPDVAVVTSLFPEHLDWHGSEEQYYRDKLNILEHGPRVIIANGENETLLSRLASHDVQWVGDGNRYRLADRNGVDWIMRGEEPIVPRSQLKLLGRHNAINATLALAAVDAVDPIDADEAAERLSTFLPLENRLEPITDPSGLTFVNDSLSTSPYAAIEALRAFPSTNVTLIVGGQDRGVDYAPLADYLRGHPIAAVIGLPPSGQRILDEITSTRTVVSSGMRHAVELARELTPAGGTVLLSPAAPSYGVYRDFAERAADFKRTIAETA
jgi:UDP-N-acetylmuramoylalanine--D-glutamate ligase